MSFQAVPRDGHYAVRRTGATRALVVGMTKDAAWKEARRLARGQGARAYLYGLDGRIVARNDYGAAP